MQPSSTCHDAIVLAVALFFSTFAKSELVPPENPTYSEMGYPTPGDVVSTLLGSRWRVKPESTKIDTSANASGNNRCTNQDFGGFIPEAACMSDGVSLNALFSMASSPIILEQGMASFYVLHRSRALREVLCGVRAGFHDHFRGRTETHQTRTPGFH